MPWIVCSKQEKWAGLFDGVWLMQALVRCGRSGKPTSDLVFLKTWRNWGVWESVVVGSIRKGDSILGSYQTLCIPKGKRHAGQCAASLPKQARIFNEERWRGPRVGVGKCV